MKIVKTILTVMSVAFSCFSYAAVYDDVLYIVNHKGPDFYSDGSMVVDGETYAVVFQRGGTEFAGFDSCGRLVNTNDSRLVAALPFAKNGRCIPFMLQMPKDYVASLGEGSFDIYLIDSRKSFTRDGYILADSNTTNELGFVRNYAKVGKISGESMSRSIDVPGRTYAMADGAAPIDMTPYINETTNVVEVVKTNTVTEIVEVTTTNYVDKVVERTVVRYIDVERPPAQPGPEQELKTIPSVDSGKTSTYDGIVYDSLHNAVGSAVVKLYAPNSYGIMRGSATLKIDVPGKKTKKTYTKTFYGMVDDLGGASGYFKKYAGKISFKLKLGEGFVEVYDTKTKSNIEYEIECEFVK